MSRRRIGTMVLGVFVLGASACTRDEPIEIAREQQGGPSDATITMNIQSRYFSDDALKAREVDVDTENGVVTLTGSVPSEAARGQAENIAQSVTGVTRVQNNLRVEAETAGVDQGRPNVPAISRTGKSADDADDRVNASWITTKIQAQYFADVDVKGRTIDVTTSPDGRVTLAGTVTSTAERDEALRIARTTEGVREVIDRLRVEAATAGPGQPATAADRNALTDPWITMKVESKYFLDSDVKGRDIDVTTQNGIVILNGEVTSAAEKRQAVLLAESTEGVTQVRDELRVVAVRADDATERGGASDVKDAASRTAAAANDEWIEAKIQAKYFLEGDLKNDDISVDSARGVVTLQGRVDSADQKRIAEEIAKETDGVRNVVNRIQVTTSARAPR